MNNTNLKLYVDGNVIAYFSGTGASFAPAPDPNGAKLIAGLREFGASLTDEEKGLKVNDLNPIRKRYKNAVEYRIHNRRVVIGRIGEWWYIVWHIYEHDPDVPFKQRRRETEVKLSQEGAELLLFGLAEMLNLKVAE